MTSTRQASEASAPGRRQRDGNLVLAVDATQSDLVRAVHAQGQLAAVVTSDPSRLARPVLCPTFTDLGAALSAVSATRVCFTSVRPHLDQEVETCVDEGVHVLAPGPPDMGAERYARLVDRAREREIALSWGGWLVSSAGIQLALQQSREDGFGEPVYFRCVAAGGGSALSTWWSARELLAVARLLLGASLERVWIGATRIRRTHHAVVTAEATNAASAQLVIAPCGPGGHLDMLLLGAGGLLDGTGAERALRPPQAPPRSDTMMGPIDSEWLRDWSPCPAAAPGDLVDTPPFAADRRLLHALRRSARDGRPVSLPYQPGGARG